MKKSITAVCSVVVLLGLAAIPQQGANAAPPQAAAAAAVGAPTEPFYVQRELAASATIRTELTQIRQQIAAGGNKYTVGYTTAMDRPMSALAGLKIPADAVAQATQQFSVQSQLLQRDIQRQQDLVKKRPTLKIPADATPNFTATSAQGDWRTQGKVTPIKDQGYCGSCWAFAVMGAYESSHLIRNNATVDSAEQVLVSCSNAGNCGGGWPGTALQWIMDHGQGLESVFPYTASNAACHAYTTSLNEAAWGYIRPNETIATTAELKQHIVTYGPVVVAVQATPAFKAYSSGIFSQAVPAGVRNHAVVLVGWDDSKGAWILRNSWGTGWGETCGYGTERGYMWLTYGSNNVGIMSNWVRATKVL
jgi:cathepsin L